MTGPKTEVEALRELLRDAMMRAACWQSYVHNSRVHPRLEERSSEQLTDLAARCAGVGVVFGVSP